MMVTPTDDTHAGRVPYSVHGEHPKINRSYPQIAWFSVLNIPLLPAVAKLQHMRKRHCSAPLPPLHVLCAQGRPLTAYACSSDRDLLGPPEGIQPVHRECRKWTPPEATSQPVTDGRRRINTQLLAPRVQSPQWRADFLVFKFFQLCHLSKILHKCLYDLWWLILCVILTESQGT